MTCPGCGNTVSRLRNIGKDEWRCNDCKPDMSKPIKVTERKHFPFVTSNIRGDGRPVEVKSLRHLRQLENKHGVQSSAWN
jgi:hypothetical protein